MQCTGLAEESYGLYVLGVADEEVSAHLAARCQRCEAEVAAYRRVWSHVGAATPQVKPRRALRSRVIQSVGGRVFTWWWAAAIPAMAGACALAFVVGAAWRKPSPEIAFSPVYRVEIPAGSPAPPPEVRTQTIVKQVPVPGETRTEVRTVTDPAQAAAIAALNQDLSREKQLTARLQAELTAAQSKTVVAADTGASQRRIGELERQVAQYRVLLEAERKRSDSTLLLASMAGDPSLRIVKLRGTEKGQNLEGHALLAGNSRMVFYASQLPALPNGRVYQLWLIRSSGPAIASAGIFAPDAGRGSVQLRDPTLLTGVTAFAVTDEPAGGSAQPTGHKWLVGS